MSAADDKGLIEALKGKGEVDPIELALAVEDVEDLEQLYFEEESYKLALTDRSNLVRLNACLVTR